MKLTCVALIAWSFLLTFGSPQLSEFERRDLRGLTRLKLLVANLDEDALRCGVTKEDLSLAAARAFVGGAPSLTEKAGTTLRIEITALHQNPTCVINLHLSVLSSARVQLAHAADESIGLALLWEQGSLFAGSASTTPKRVADQVKIYLDQFVTKVKLANAK